MAIKKVKFETLNLKNPNDARRYVKDFEIPGEGKSCHLETNKGRKIYFDNMTDDDACVAAHLLQDYLIEASKTAIKH